MRAGGLRHKIELQSAVETQDSFGQPAPTWSTYATAWASVEVESVSELAQSEKWVNQRRYTLTVRFRDDVETEHRVVLPGGEVLEIAGAYDPDGKRTQTILDCLEVS